jgi:hypothetical protein
VWNEAFQRVDNGSLKGLILIARRRGETPMLRIPLIVSLFVLASANCAKSQDKPVKSEDKPVDPDKASTLPAGLPLELRIINSSLEAYEVDSRGDPFYKFQEKIKKAVEGGIRLYPTKVEMELEFKNTGTSAVQIWVGGDSTLLTLNLQGNGARTAEVKPTPSNKVIPPVVVKIPAGKSHRIPLTELAYGFRNESIYAYITETGQYHLSATFRTAISPAPKKPLRLFDKGFGEIQLKSAPIAFRVLRQS